MPHNLAGGGALVTRLALDKPTLPGINGDLCAVCQKELAEDIADMTLDRVLADEQFFRDLVLGQAIGDQLEHIRLPDGQFGKQRLVAINLKADVLEDACCPFLPILEDDFSLH